MSEPWDLQEILDLNDKDRKHLKSFNGILCSSFHFTLHLLQKSPMKATHSLQHSGWSFLNHSCSRRCLFLHTSAHFCHFVGNVKMAMTITNHENWYLLGVLVCVIFAVDMLFLSTRFTDNRKLQKSDKGVLSNHTSFFGLYFYPKPIFFFSNLYPVLLFRIIFFGRKQTL